MTGKLAPDFVKSARTATSELKAVEKGTKDIKKAAERRASANSLKAWTQSVSGVKKSLGGLKGELLGLGKIAAGLFAGNGLIGGAIYGVAKSSAGYADQSHKTAQGVGMTTQAYTELAYAADMAGVNQQLFAMSMGKTNKVIADALGGNQKAKDIFTRTGISIRDANGEIKTAEAMLGDLAEAFAAMPDGVGKTKLAMDLFGEAGTKLIPFLNAGKKGIDAQREAARKLGVTLTEQDGINAEGFNDSFANIGKSLRGATLIVGKSMWAPLTKVHEFISDKILTAAQDLAQVMPEWVTAFEEGWEDLKPELDAAWVSIKDGAKYVNDIAQSMGGWVPVIKSVVKYWLYWRGIRIGKSLWDVGKAVRGLGQNFLGLQYAGVSVQGAMVGLGGKLKGVFVGALSGVSKALSVGSAAALKFGAALLANPIGLAIAGIAALGGTVYLCIKHWDDITAAVGKAWTWIKGVFASGWKMLPEWVQTPLASAYDAVAGFGGSVVSAFSMAWDSVTGRFSSVIDSFDGGLLKGLTDLIVRFSPAALFIDGLNALSMMIFDFDLKSAGMELARKLGDGILSAWTGIKDSLKSAIVDWIPGGSTIMSGIGGAADGVASAAGWVSDNVSSILPFADGGIVTRPQLALVGEAGPEVIVPMSRPQRARDLLGAAASIVGDGRGPGGVALSFSPTITIAGSADASVLAQLEERLRRLKDEMFQELDNRVRTSRRTALW